MSWKAIIKSNQPQYSLREKFKARHQFQQYYFNHGLQAYHSRDYEFNEKLLRWLPKDTHLPSPKYLWPIVSGMINFNDKKHRLGKTQKSAWVGEFRGWAFAIERECLREVKWKHADLKKLVKEESLDNITETGAESVKRYNRKEQVEEAGKKLEEHYRLLHSWIKILKG